MAFQFNAILDFKADGAVAGMKQAKAGFESFKESVGKANASFSQVMGGAQSTSIALAPLSVGFGLATKDAAQFEQGIADVQATMLETKANMRPLEVITKQLGAATKFSAVEATQGAMFFAQAGFDMQQIIAALPGAMDAAAAGGMNLATTTDIMASAMGAFGIQAKEAGHVADVLALASSLTNTDMIGLGEGLKYAAATAHTAGMSLEDTASALGIMSNAGMKGSAGGTALSNALLQLTKPTKEVLGLFGGQGGLNQAILDSSGNLLPFEVIVANVSKVVDHSSNKLESAGKAAEIFGLRGAHAFGAFAGQLQGTTVVTDLMMKRFQLAGVNVEKEGIHLGSVIPTLVAIRYQINGAAGAAKEMAETRMKTLVGQMEQLKGATQGLSIEVGELLLGSLTGGSAVATDAISMLAFGFQALSMNADEFATFQLGVTDKSGKMYNQFGAFLPMFRDFAGGFKEGLLGVIDGLKAGFQFAVDFFGAFKGTDMTVKEIGKLVGQLLLVGAIIAPVLAGIVGFAFIMGPIVSAVGGMFGLVSSVFGMITSAVSTVFGAVTFLAGALGIGVLPFIAIAAAIVGVLAVVYIFRAEIWGFLTDFGAFAKETAIGFYTDFMEALVMFAPFVDQTFTEIGAYFVNLGTGLVDMFMFAFDTIKTLVIDVSTFISTAFSDTFSTAFAVLKPMMVGFGAFMLDIFLAPLRMMLQGLSTIVSTIADYIPNSVLEKVGLQQSDLQNFATNMVLPTFSQPSNGVTQNVDEATRVAKDNNSLNQDVLSQKALVQPPSADDISSILSSQSSNQSKDSGGGGQQTVKVIVEGRIKGQDLNLSMTRSQVEQSQLNGRSPEPIVKRRAISNGQQFGG